MPMYIVDSEECIERIISLDETFDAIKLNDEQYSVMFKPSMDLYKINKAIIDSNRHLFAPCVAKYSFY